MTSSAETPLAVTEPARAPQRRDALAVVGAAAVVAVALWVALLSIGTDSLISADEGAAIVQAESLAEGRGWIVEHPAPELDREGRWYPFELSYSGSNGTAPFARHPLYTVTLAGSISLFGQVGPFVVSMAATVIASLVVGLTLRSSGRNVGVAGVLVTGFVTTLFFNGLFVVAHALAAMGVAVLLYVVARSTSVGVVGGVTAAVAVYLVNLRTEGRILPIAIVGVAVVAWWRWRSAAYVALGLGAAAGLVAGEVIKQQWIRSILGEVYPSTAEARSSGWVTDRLDSFSVTVIGTSYGDVPAAADYAALFVPLLLLAAVGVHVRKRDAGLVAVLVTAAALAATVRTVVGPGSVIPGLLPAAPLVVAGTVAWAARSSDKSRAERVAVGIAVLTAGGVFLTQYAQGGSLEWGWRYVALTMPLVVPAVVVGFGAVKRDLQPSVWPYRIIAVGLSVVAVTSVVQATLSLREGHQLTRGVTDGIASTLRANADADDLIAVGLAGTVPRLATDELDLARWLLVEPDELTDFGNALGTDDVQSTVVVIGLNADDEATAVPNTSVVDVVAFPSVPGWYAVVLQESTADDAS